MRSRPVQFSWLRVPSTEPHLPSFSGVIWSQNMSKSVRTWPPVVMLPTNFLRGVEVLLPLPAVFEPAVPPLPAAVLEPPSPPPAALERPPLPAAFGDPASPLPAVPDGR